MTTMTHQHEITNTCTCTQYDFVLGDWTDEPATDCYGDCWDMVLDDFREDTKSLRESNTTGWWKCTDLRLWNRNVSGYFHADTVAKLLEGMTVRSEWIMRYTVHEDRVEYSLSHHDAMGSATTLTPVSEDEAEELGL